MKQKKTSLKFFHQFLKEMPGKLCQTASAGQSVFAKSSCIVFVTSVVLRDAERCINLLEMYYK